MNAIKPFTQKSTNRYIQIVNAFNMENFNIASEMLKKESKHIQQSFKNLAEFKDDYAFASFINTYSQHKLI
jgi:hypothetical protein